jgi:DNA-binding SARP family transcriptional activator
MASIASEITTPVRLQLFGWWDLHIGDQELPLGRREQRLVALLALTGRRPRVQVAGMLWPDTTETRAMSNLRVAVWQVRHTAPALLSVDRTTLALSCDVAVDVDETTTYAGLAASAPASLDFDETLPLLQQGELLPGWYDDWVLFERERVEHLRMRALESLAHSALQRGKPQQAVMAARAATTIEPLHEAAHLLLVRACVASGATAEAVQHYKRYRARLVGELGIRPSPQFAELLQPLVAAPRPRVPAAVQVRR